MCIFLYFFCFGVFVLVCVFVLFVQVVECVWSYSYNVFGLIECVDGLCIDVQDVIFYVYDSCGNLIQVINVFGQVICFGDYDECGKFGSIIDVNGVISSFVYIGVDGWLVFVSIVGSIICFDYDVVGQIICVICGDGSWLSYEYDDVWCLVVIGNNFGECFEYDVDIKGNCIVQCIKDVSGSLVCQQ